MSPLPLYLDFAATTPVDSRVLEKMTPYFTQYFGNSSSKGHAHGWMANDAIDNARQEISRAFSCNSSEIIFTSGATESINLVLKSFASSRIVTSSAEHKATLDVAYELETNGSSVSIVGVDTSGIPDYEEITERCKNTPSLLSLLIVNNETGIITDVSAVEKVKKETGCFVHFDASQALGKLEMKPYYELADFISFSGHKIFAPKGVGGLISKHPSLLKPQVVGGGQQRNLRSGTLNVPGIVGLGAAVSYCDLSSFDQVKSLQTHFEKEIKRRVPFVSIAGVESPRSPFISNICFHGFDGEELINRFHKIAISNGSACNSASTQPSHVLKAMGFSDADAFASLRFSFAHTTTQDQLNDTLAHVEEVISSL